MQEGLRPLDCMMAQEEILEDLEKEAQIQPKEEFEEVNPGADSGSLKPIFISSQLSTKEREQFMEIMKRYVDVFAWTYDEMSDLDSVLVVHSLNVDPRTKPVIQPTRIFHIEIEGQITQEVKKCLRQGSLSLSNILNGSLI